MKALGLDLGEFATSFVEVDGKPFVFIEVAAEKAATWAELLGVPARRCYITDDQLRAAAARANVAGSDVAAAKIPDPGSVMSGDFGEIVTAFYFATRELPNDTLDPKRWRLKQDRTKAAPNSDVVQLLLPSWPDPSTDDRVICAEVKTKATNGNSTPVASAVADSRKDREGRLTKTLVWLRERALVDGLETVEIAQLDRFINAIDHPPAVRDFRAVAVINAEFVDAETADVQAPAEDECTLIVISVPDLKANYEALFAEIVASADQVAKPPTQQVRA